MAKKPRAKTKAVAREQQIGSIFDHFAEHNPGYDLTESPQPSEPRGKRAEAPSIDVLLARLDALEAQNRELAAAAQRSALVPMRPAPVPERAAPQAPERLDLAGLPDPMAKPEEYNAELARRVDAFVKLREHASNHARTTEQATTRTAEQLWTEFSAKHPEWASHKELVGVMAEKAARKAQAQGLDTQAYMNSGATLFFKDIINELNASGYSRLVEPAEDDEEEFDTTPERTAPERKQARPATPFDDDDEDGRTAGIFGGQEGGNRPTPGKPKAGDMLEDLRSIQARTGFF